MWELQLVCAVNEDRLEQMSVYGLFGKIKMKAYPKAEGKVKHC